MYPYDSESLNERIKIRESIESGRIERAISLINNLHPELIDNNRLLAFHLQVIIKLFFLNTNLNAKNSINKRLNPLIMYDHGPISDFKPVFIRSS